MNEFWARLDDLAQINQKNESVKWLERVAFVFLTLMVLSAPHSIAASQGAWLGGMLVWGIRAAFKPRPKFFRSPLNWAFLLFGGWAILSAVLSYAPDISIDRLRSVGIFLVFFFVVNNLRTKRAAVFLAFALISSCLISAIWTPVERIIGRGVAVYGVSEESPLQKGILPISGETKYIKDGDTIVKIGKNKIFSPEEFIAELEKKETTAVQMYRPDYDYIIEIKKSDLLAGTSALERLGIEKWNHSHTWRSAGFYGHYTTFAEVLQLIAALAGGILIILLRHSLSDSRSRNLTIWLGLSFALFALALLLTATRASQAGLMLACFVMLLLAASRKMLIAACILAIPVVIVGVIYLERSRNVEFIDGQDNSTTWRQTVYREGLNLATNSPRHLLVGVGMDSVKRYAKDWHLFDDGKLPMGHFHSTPLQLAVERGVPSLIIWLWILGFYGNTLRRQIKSGEDRTNEKIETGILLGCFGGLVGFFAAGLVHYNLGDGEVAMVFYLLMGIGVFLAQTKKDSENEPL